MAEGGGAAVAEDGGLRAEGLGGCAGASFGGDERWVARERPGARPRTGGEVVIGGRLCVRVCVVQEDREFLGLPCETLSWTFDTQFMHGHHHGADELVSSLQTQKFILPVGLVEEDDVEGDRVGFVDGGQFGEDVLLIFSVLGADEFK